MAYIFRARLSSFLAGFAVASGYAIYQLRNDVQESHLALIEQAQGVEKRLKQLEEDLKKSGPKAAAGLE
jgi:hypothetical protein